MKIRAIIVDDEERHHSILSKMLNNFCPNVNIVGAAYSVNEVINQIEEHQPNLLFLDIEMPGGNGFTIFDHFEEPPFQVIFTTAFDLYAINAIKYAALDYLLKPINIQELKNAVERAEKVLQKQSTENLEKIQALKSNIQLHDKGLTKIALRSSQGIDFVEADEVIRVEANQVYSNFYLNSGKKILVSKPLGEFESMLESCNFFRVHKSHIINLKHIAKYVKGKGGYVIMKDGSNVDVSVRKKDKFLKRLM